MAIGYQNLKFGGISLSVIALLLLIVTALPAQAGYGGLWGYLNSSEYILKCEQAKNRSGDYFHSNVVSIKQPLAISFCNMGLYDIDTVKLKVWRKDNEKWVLVYEDKISSNFGLGKGVYWSGHALNKKANYKFKVIYKIAAGEKKACTKVIDSINRGILWKTYSSGSTFDQNKCRQIDFEQ